MGWRQQGSSRQCAACAALHDRATLARNKAMAAHDQR
jgi:hypothetical protein